jgi:hypothetical protein
LIENFGCLSYAEARIDGTRFKSPNLQPIRKEEVEAFWKVLHRPSY